MKKSDIFWQTYLNLEKEVIEVSKFIFVTDVKTVYEKGVEKVQPYKTQLETYSPHIADLLVRCCVQIEAVSKELYFELGGEKKRGESTIKFDTDCLKLLNKERETHKKKVLVVAPFFNLTNEENLVLRPLKDAHKQQGTYWERCYQAVKHDRYACLCCGNVKALIHALAALFLLNIYMRKDSWQVSYKDLGKMDFSIGSSLFSIVPPVAGDIWYGNQPKHNDSPYVIVYQDEAYKRIEKAQQAENDARIAYWQQQPELKEKEFIDQLNAEFDKKKQDPNHRVIVIWELAKYRLNKLVPQGLPFEERKSRLINSEAWRTRTHQQNNHLTPEDITEENIQQEINIVAIRWGMDIEWSFKKEQWELFATSSAMCKVFIP